MRQRIVFLLLVLMNIMAAVTLYNVYLIHQANERSFEATRDNRTMRYQDPDHLTDNLSVLLLGMDRKQEGVSRTDAIILATYDVKGNAVNLVRIPRDTYIEYEGYTGKINGLYGVKGRDALINAVGEYLEMPVTHYVETDFAGLRNIVDTLGGVTVDSRIRIDHTNNQQVGDVTIRKGRQTLDGREALAYSRIRYIDDDISRGDRQEQVLTAIVRKMTSPENLPSLGHNVQALSPYVTTNINKGLVIDHVTSIASRPMVRPVRFKWEGYTGYDGASYVRLHPAERLRVANEVRTQYGLSALREMNNTITGGY